MGGFGDKGKKLEHICLEVEGREMFLKNCASKGIKTFKILKGSSFVVFIKGYDDNLFEIKEKNKGSSPKSVREK